MMDRAGRPHASAPRISLGISLRAILFMVLAVLGIILVLSTAADTLRSSLINLTARCTAAALNLLGASARAQGPLLSTPYGPVEIIYECTGLFPVVIVLAAILVFPCGWRWKVLGVGLGVSVIFVLNQIRILSLIYLNSFMPEVTETVHHLVWPILIIFLTVLLFVAWARTALDGR